MHLHNGSNTLHLSREDLTLVSYEASKSIADSVERGNANLFVWLAFELMKCKGQPTSRAKEVIS